MLVDPSNQAAGSAVTGAIRQAAQATGTSFQYLLATARVESGLNPHAGTATSSARGLFQFIDQTWLATIKQSGAALGYGQYAAAITKTASGHYQVSDPAMRSEILKLRNDPTANAMMAGAFTKANAAVLSDKLGRAPSEGELYIAHFMGVGGAARLISSAAADPTGSAASYFPIAARANASIFYDRSTGQPRSLAEVRNLLTARYDVATRSRPSMDAVAQADLPPSAIPSAVSAARSASAPNAVASTFPLSHPVRTIPIFSHSAATAPATPVAAAVPDTAGMTNAFAEAAPPARNEPENDIFHGLFSDPGRSGPVAAVVSQLWGVGTTPPPAGADGSATPSGGTLLDLFKDNQRGT
ncbi:MAG: transglycosylase SLT domain-containing protein [Xanthobacteraceae bacterium]